MLYWTKYKIIDELDEGILIWNTRTSVGINVGGNVKLLMQSIKDGVWNELIDAGLKQLLIESETLITYEQYNTEELLVKNFRASPTTLSFF